jgi:hypothetical protein
MGVLLPIQTVMTRDEVDCITSKLVPSPENGKRVPRTNENKSACGHLLLQVAEEDGRLPRDGSAA